MCHEQRGPAVTCAGVLTVWLMGATALSAQAPSPSAPRIGDTSFAMVPWVWRNIGPANISGMVSDIAVPFPGTPDGPRAGAVIYVGAPGGLFKSVDGGTRWKPLLDAAPSTSVNCVVVAPSDPEVVWIGTGNFHVSFGVKPGRGILKSTDGGEQWSSVGFASSEYVGDIAIHPRDANTVYAAVIGPLTRASRERGVYKTTDGGRTWTQVHFVDDWTGAVDLAIDPVNPEIVYAATWQQALTPRLHVDFGAGSGLWQSTDGGASWRRLTKGLPKEALARSGIAVSPASPNMVYALLAPTGGRGRDSRGAVVYRSRDYGETWERGGTSRSGASNSGYFGRLWADPRDPGRVYLSTTTLSESTDSGRTVVDIPNHPHADPHALWIDPSNPSHIIMGNDRGLFVSETRARTWRHSKTLTLTRLWHLDAGPGEFFYHAFAVAQDAWGQEGPTRSRYGFGILNDEWRQTSAGEAGAMVADLTDSASVYVLAGQIVERFDLRTQGTTRVFPFVRPWDTTRVGDVDVRRVAAIASRHTPRVLYRGSNRVWRVAGTELSWRSMSPPLTQRGPDSATIMGRFERDWPGVLAGHGRILAMDQSLKDTGIEGLAESPRDGRILYVGTQAGHVTLTRDGGQTWVRASALPGAPPGAPVSSVVASHFADGTAYAAVRAIDHGDLRAHVFKTSDYGAHWTRISGNLPHGAVVWDMAEHFRTPGLLFLGTDDGVYASIDDGVTWAKLRGNLPQAGRARNLLVQRDANDLVVSVWGRGIWVLDDLAPLEHWSRAVRAGRSYLVPVRNALRFQRGAGSDGYSSQRFSTPNPPYGALITFFRPPSASSRRETLDITNQAGEIVRTFEVDPSPGLHRFAWDLRRATLGGADGPEVRPGTYAVRVRGQADARTFQVVRDPLHALSAATEDSIDADARLGYRVQAEALAFSAVSTALIRQLDSARTLLRRRGDKSLSAGADALRDSAAALHSVIDRAPWDLLKDERAGYEENTRARPMVFRRVLEWRGVRDNNAVASTMPLPPLHRELLGDAQRATQRQRQLLRALIEGPIATLDAAIRRAGAASPFDTGSILARFSAPILPVVSRAIDYTEPLVESWSGYWERE